MYSVVTPEREQPNLHVWAQRNYADGRPEYIGTAVTTYICCFQLDESFNAVQGFVAFNNFDEILDHEPPFSGYDALRMELHALHHECSRCKSERENGNT